MIRRPRLYLTGIVALQAVYLMVVGYIMRCGLIDWRHFGRLLLMALAVGVVFLPFFSWVHKKRLGKRIPWSTVLIFITVLLSVPLGSYFWPHTYSQAEDGRKYLLELCLLFVMVAPIFTFGMRGGENQDPK